MLAQFWSERPQIFGFVRRYVYSREEREDIFQEACLRFLASQAAFGSMQAAAKYFYKTIRTLIVSHIRQAVRLEFPGTLTEVSYDPHSECENQMLIDRVCEEVANLPHGDRSVFAAQLDADLPSLKDKAETLNLSVRAFRYRRTVTIGKLQRVLREKRDAHNGRNT